MNKMLIKPRPNPRVKIEDVARQAAVSAATVSRVLNHPQIVRLELRDKVKRAIAELSYTRDGAARALKSGRMRTIGAIVPTLGLSIFAEGVEALQNRLSETGYTLFIANSQYDQRRELQELQSLIERGIDGIVLVGGSHAPELRTLVQQAGVPVITTYVSKSQGGIPAVGIDNQGATRELTQYLLKLGHLRFGAIANVPPSNDRSRARLDGIQKALADAGIHLQPTQIIRADFSLAQGRSALRQLMNDHPEYNRGHLHHRHVGNRRHGGGAQAGPGRSAAPLHHRLRRCRTRGTGRSAIDHHQRSRRRDRPRRRRLSDQRHRRPAYPENRAITLSADHAGIDGPSSRLAGDATRYGQKP